MMEQATSLCEDNIGLHAKIQNNRQKKLIEKSKKKASYEAGRLDLGQ